MSVEPQIPWDTYDPMLNIVLVFFLAVLLLLFAYGKLAGRNKKGRSNSEKSLDEAYEGELEELTKEGNVGESPEIQEMSEIRKDSDSINSDTVRRLKASLEEIESTEKKED